MASSQSGNEFSKTILRFFHILQLVSTLKSQQYPKSDLRRFCDFFGYVAECAKKVDIAQRTSLDSFICSLRPLFPLLDESFFNFETLENGKSFLEKVIEDNIGLQHIWASKPKSTTEGSVCAPFFLDCSSPVLKLKNKSETAVVEFLDCWFILDSTSMLRFCLEQFQFGDPSASDRLLSWLEIALSKKVEIFFDLVNLGHSRVRDICISYPKFAELICRSIQSVSSVSALSNKNQQRILELTRLLANCGLLRTRTL